jgi:hypothetical protein
VGQERCAAVLRCVAQVAISTALDQFKADHKAYPGMTVPALPPNVNPNNALAYALVAPGDQEADGASGPGFRYQTAPNSSAQPASAKLWPSYLDASKFKVKQDPLLPDGTQLKRGWELFDAYEVPIVYLPRRKTTVRPEVGLLREYPAPKSPGAYDVLDVNGYLDVLKTGDARKSLLMGLGDLNADGVINNGEAPKFQGDYVLMSAGPDATFFTGGSAAEFEKADDVFNFDR